MSGIDKVHHIYGELVLVLLVAAAAGFANVEMQARYDARNPQAIKRLVAAGTQLRPYSSSIMEACLKASNEVNAETSAVNEDYKKVWDSIAAFRDDEYLWWQIAEYSYDPFMIRHHTELNAPSPPPLVGDAHVGLEA